MDAPTTRESNSKLIATPIATQTLTIPKRKMAGPIALLSNDLKVRPIREISLIAMIIANE
jgi:hypothetical protein